MKASICSVPSCGRSALHADGGSRGFCGMHYQRNKKYGDPLYEWKQKTPAMDWIKEHVNSTSDACITWPFHIGKDGYGRVHNPYRNNSLSTASRLMCIEAHGEPPHSNSEAAHSCGNGHKGCTNPNHIYWATPVENHADKIIHGTTNRGERQGRSKLKECDVINIRNLLTTTTQAAIAKTYSVHPSVISCIKSRKSWGWLD